MADELPPDPSEVPQAELPPGPLTVADQPGPDPSIFLPALGPVLGPPPQIPIPGPPPLPPPSAQDPKQHLLAIAALGAMLGLGKQGGAGVGAGLLQAQAHLDAVKAEQFKYAQQVQQHQAAQAAAAQHQATQIYEQRQLDFQKVLLGFRAQLDKTTSQEDYDRLIQNYSGALQASGFPRATPQWFHQEFAFIPPTSEKTIQTAIDAVVKSESYKKATAADPNAWQTFAINVPLDPTHPKVLTTLPLRQAYQRLGVSQTIDPLGNVGFTPLTKGTKEQNDITEATGAFVDQFHHPPRTPADNTWIMDRIAARDAAASQAKKTPSDPEMVALAKEMAQLRIEQAKAALGQAGTTVPLGVSGEEALKGVPSDVANTVRAVVNYRIPLPGGFALRSPYWQQVLSLATAYDPSFDSTQYVARQRLRTDFTSGKGAANIRSLNTVTGHLETLQQAADALGNGNLPIWNTIRNQGLTQTGDRRIVRFNTAANAVESELATVFKGTGASDQEIHAWREQLNSSQSPAQIKGAIAQAVSLMKSRLEALQAQYTTGMGKPGDFQILTPQSERIIQQLGGDSSAPTGSGGADLIYDPASKTFTRPRGQP